MKKQYINPQTQYLCLLTGNCLLVGSPVGPGYSPDPADPGYGGGGGDMGGGNAD